MAEMELRAVVCASPAAGQVLEVEVTLPAGSRVADALDASGLMLPLDARAACGERRCHVTLCCAMATG